MIRTLIAEDSSTARELLAAVLSGDGDIAVVGQAKDGLEAVEITRRLRPDVVIMDIHMPIMDGFEATKRIMAECPVPIVVVSATVDVHDIAVSMQALRAGALSVLEKPTGPTAPEFAASVARFVATVKAMAQVKVVRRWPDPPARPPQPVERPRRAPSGARLAGGAAARVVAIAASTGGPAALHKLLSALPGDFALPILVVQHIAPGFVPGLASWLDEAARLRVKVAEAGEPIQPGTAYIAPDAQHLGVAQGGRVLLSDAPPIRGFRPSATFLFESVGAFAGAGAIGVILTGMGEDGVEGLASLRGRGGRAIAQDEASSVVFGMPGAAVRAGVVDAVLPLDEIAPALVEVVAR